MRLILVFVTLALSVAAVCQEEPLFFATVPESPHRSLSDAGKCFSCHGTYVGEVDPHEFVLPIDDMCLRESCHSSEAMGRSHPRGIDLRRSSSIKAVPEQIPLENYSVSCGSCHQPHGEWLSTTRCYKRQEAKGFLVETVAGEERRTPYYRTYFLRVPGDPEEGFVALCTSCHPR